MPNKKTARAIFASLFLLVFAGGLFPLKAAAASVTDSITLSVGYFGGPYYEKATYNWKELDDNFGGALDTHQVAYSYNSGSRVAVDSARGFYLADLLEYAGIDTGSVMSLDFYTKDQPGSAFASFSKSSLLDDDRYYFPNLSMKPDKTLVPLHGGDLTDGAVRVDTMLALEDNWEWDAVASNFTNMSPSSRFRLVFGQTDPAETKTNKSAKFVHTVYVTFAGAPVLSADKDNLDMKVGSNYQVHVKIGTADQILDKSLGGSVEWSSSDTSVVTVDKNGNLTAVSKGTAVITATSGGTSVSVIVTVSGENVAGTGNGNTGNGTGNGSGNGSGSSTGSGTGTGGGNGSGQGGSGNGTAGGTEPGADTASSPTPDASSGTGPNPTPGADASPAPSTAPNPAPSTEVNPAVNGGNSVQITQKTVGAYILSGVPMGQSGGTGGAAGGGGSPGAVTGMSEDSTQLILKKQDIPILGPMVAGAAGLLFLLGAVWGYLKFKHQLKG